jgi:transcriptional regulator with GAF, ATPase, and Fis domain
VEARALLSSAELDGRSLVVILERSHEKAPPERSVAGGPRSGLGATRSAGGAGRAASHAHPSADRSVSLAPLDARGTKALLESALGARPSSALVDAALEASGALPGRLCRLLAATLKSEKDPSDPDTLRAMSAEAGSSRVVLPPHGQTVADHLALAGGSLPGEVLASVLGADVAAGLSALAAEGAVTFGPTGEPRLRRDLVIALHGAMKPPRRRALADALAQANGADLGAEADAFVRAARGDDAAAFDSLRRALAERRARGDAEGAIALGRMAEALFTHVPPTLHRAVADALRARGRYVEALDALGDDPSLDALALRAELLRLSGRGDEAQAWLTKIEGAAEADTFDARFAARATSLRLALDRGETRAALALATRAAADAVAASDPVGEARVCEVAALAALYAGEPAEAIELCERAIAAARRARAPEVEARAHAVLASVALSRGEVRRAAERYARAFDLAEAAGETHSAAAFLLNLGVTRLDAGDLGPATDALREGARRLARLGRDQDLSRALYNLGLAGVLAGDDDLAAVAVRSARAAADRENDLAASAFASVLEAELALRDGKLGRAHDAVNEAAERAVDASPRDRAVVAARRALILAALGKLEAAKRAVEEAGVAAEADGTDLSRTEYAVARARVALTTGGPEEALAAAADARSSAERFGTYEARLRATLSSADAADAAGQHDAARRHLSAARALLDRAANTLPPAARARMRAVGAYQRAFAAVPRETGAAPDENRWRRLVFYARRLTAERRVGRLYEEILDAAIDLSGAERGFVILRDDDGSLRVRVARGLDRRAIAEDEQLFSRSLSARAIDGGAPIATVDALRDERLDGAASVHALSLRSVVAVPFRREGEVRGAIYLDDRLRPGAFGPDDVALLSDLADLASIALDGADRLRRERRQARRLEIEGRSLAHRVETQARQLESLRRSAGQSAAVGLGIVGRGSAMREMLALVERVAPSNVPALVVGESGTGKELVAKALHHASRREGGPFVIENVSAIPETLLESELFGHVRGAFTGADRSRVGLFEAASGGTLFLDEIGEMSPSLQAKLLRAVQEGVIRPVGSAESRSVDVRLITATHRDLPAMVAEGRFREDLYYRLAVVTIELPPLRDRPEDVPALVAHFVSTHGDGRTIDVDARALASLARFAWPGNVRQLENEVQRALVLCQGTIQLEHLSPAVRGDVDDEVVDTLDLKGQVQLLERRLIADALHRAGGNQTKAAKLLGVSRYGLSKMMKRLELA